VCIFFNKIFCENPCGFVLCGWSVWRQVWIRVDSCGYKHLKSFLLKILKVTHGRGSGRPLYKGVV
jgi:hypothetical protein